MIMSFIWGTFFSHFLELICLLIWISLHLKQPPFWLFLFFTCKQLIRARRSNLPRSSNFLSTLGVIVKLCAFGWMAGKWFLRVITQTVKPPFPSCICVCMISRGFFGPFFSYRRSRTFCLINFCRELFTCFTSYLKCCELPVAGGCVLQQFISSGVRRGLQRFRKERRKTHLGSVLNIFGVLSWHCYNLQTCSSNSQWRVQGSKPQAWTAKMAGAYFYELIK